MSSPMPRPRDEDEPVDDASIVPGLGPSAYPPTGAPLDLSKDPDRFDPDRDPADDLRDPTVPGGPLDRSLDPDRYRPPGQGQTLTDLLGEGAHEDERNNLEWLYGLIGIVAFLALVSWFFGSVVGP